MRLLGAVRGTEMSCGRFGDGRLRMNFVQEEFKGYEKKGDYEADSKPIKSFPIDRFLRRARR